ncbi:CHASE2 and HATPase_c domain-containing protein [Novosphingobium sp. 1949]|uniref:histidine kinase n=1 Tax=Novosphingobium organovorum TaxID=2930092 RepID=A0ABT0BC94_9SPHN|nr:CHASE2 and HATPase_c domain-containing protein [Novosphingobium organovorum]MCJ2182574.1 CHASE2 and HATPase_c domain-containing protein [Novosphingobium organovorum]
MRARLLLEWVLVTLLTCAGVAALIHEKGTERLDNVLYDSLLGLAAPPPSDRIVLVTIDDESVARLGRWPWPRAVHARVLESLAHAHAAAVAYDILFTETARPDEDQALARALRDAGNVALPMLFEAPGRNGRTIDVTRPIPLVASAARSLGQVALFPDSDGTARSVPLSLRVDGHLWPHLMEETYRIAEGHPSPLYTRHAAQGTFLATIPFPPTSGHFRTLSFASVLTGEVPPEFLDGQIVLVGVTASGLGDRFTVPSRAGGIISGIELQANVLNALLNQRLIATPGPALHILLSLLPVLGLMLGFWWLRPAKALTVSLAMVALVLAVPAALLVFAHVWLAPSAALTGLLVAYPLWGWRRLQAIDAQIAEELDAFAREDSPLPLADPAWPLHDRVGGQATRLRQAIANMRDLRQLVSDTIESVDDAILVTDSAGTTSLTNAAARTMLARASGDAAQSPDTTLPPTARLAATDLVALSGGEVVDTDGLRELRLPDDTVYSLRAFPLRDHTGVERGTITHLVDITAIRRAQRDRQEALEFLSHDMRSPQSSIITLLERQRETIGDPALAARIAGLARKTLDLADDFVQLARLSSAPFAPEEIDLVAVLTEAVDEVWPRSSRQGVHVTIAAPEEGLYIAGEHGALARALVNLLDNAIRFSPAEATIACRVECTGPDSVTCSIEDEGPGIPEERRRNLFARFGYRSQGAKGSVSAGLGLAFVATVVTRHGGAITCEPRLPTGTRFAIQLPAIV